MTKRRQRVHRDIRRYAHPRAKMEKGLTKFQLAAIGAVALAYNELEVAVDLLRSAVIALPHEAGNSATREAKIGSIAKGLANVELESLIESFMERLSQVFMRRVLSDRTNYLWRFQRPGWIWPWGLLDWLQRAR